MSQRSIEVKVGALILVALGLLGAFVVVMGGLSFEPTFTVYVSFHNPGGLQAGAPVRISGVKVGRVSSMEFRGGQLDPKTHEREPLIRAVAKLEKRYQEAVRQNSRWFVTSQGVLGEMFLAVEPGSFDKPVLSDGATVQGISPPRLDLLLARATSFCIARTSASPTTSRKSRKLSTAYIGR
ncbi:MAG: MlaD family protein [Polyangiaceae bacterium]